MIRTLEVDRCEAAWTRALREVLSGVASDAVLVRMPIEDLCTPLDFIERRRAGEATDLTLAMMSEGVEPFLPVASATVHPGVIVEMTSGGPMIVDGTHRLRGAWTLGLRQAWVFTYSLGGSDPPATLQPIPRLRILDGVEAAQPMGDMMRSVGAPWRDGPSVVARARTLLEKEER